MHRYGSAAGNGFDQLILGEKILELDGEEIIAAAGSSGSRVSSAAALLVAVAVDLAEVAEVGAADARDHVMAEVLDGPMVAAHLEGEVVQGALPVHDEPVLLRANVPHRAEHLVERPVVRVGHRHQPGEEEETFSAQSDISQPFFRWSITVCKKEKEKEKEKRNEKRERNVWYGVGE